MKKTFFLILLLFTGILSSSAQDRYLEEVFEGVTVQSNINYGTNIQSLNGLTQIDLFMDVYQPIDDTEGERPLVVIAHTGTFLPIGFNKGATGEKTDSTVVELANRLAKRGFVVAAIDYRIGWNPIADNEDERKKTLINAAYRGVQDLSTCVRYFKKDIVTNNNSFKVDGSRVTAFGVGTGGYISYAVATLDTRAEAEIEKFLYLNEENVATPMVLPEESGWVDGLGFPEPSDTNYQKTSLGIDAIYNLPNHIGYDSEIHFAFSAGGALADTSWIDENTIPFAAMQVDSDITAPFLSAVLTEPVNDEAIVEVQGAGFAVPIASAKGVNAILDERFFEDVYSDRARARCQELASLSEQYAHLKSAENVFPLVRPYAHAAPWEWWDAEYWDTVDSGTKKPDANENYTVHEQALLDHPDMSKELAMVYIDSIVGFFVPRAVVALDLPGQEKFSIISGLNSVQSIKGSIFPNPAENAIRLSISGEKIHFIKIFDMAGNLVREINNINKSEFTLHKNDLSTGMYVLKLQVNDRILAEKIMFK